MLLAEGPRATGCLPAVTADAEDAARAAAERGHDSITGALRCGRRSPIATSSLPVRQIKDGLIADLICFQEVLMSRGTLIRGGIAALLLGTLSAAPAKEPQTRPDPQSTIRSLGAELAAERAQNQELTDKLRQMTRQLADLQRQLDLARHAPLRRAPLLQPRREVPDGWQLRQFNGIDYYLVPLNGLSSTDPT